MQERSHGKLIGLLLLFVAAIVGFVIYFGVIKPQQQYHARAQVKIDGVFLPAPKEITDFNLTDNKGNAFTKENLKGRWTMMFFGFTNCGYVCPTTLSALNKMYQSLQKDLSENQLPQVLFISVDPDRDSIKRINSFVSSFNANFIGARAEIEELAALEKQLNIAVVKMMPPGKGKDRYNIDHSAEILLFNPDGKLQAYFSFPHEAPQMIKDYKAIIAA